MTTIRNILRSSARLAGIIGDNVDLQGQALDTARECLSMMLDRWSTRPSMHWKHTVTTYPIVNDTVTLATRPVRVMDVVYVQNDVSYKMSEIDIRDYYRLPIKHAGIPNRWMYDGLTTISIVGRGPGDVRVITQESFINVASDLDAQFVMPNGYDSAVKYNLAVLLCEEFGREASPTVMSVATAMLDDIKSPNIRPQKNPTDASYAFGKRGAFSPYVGPDTDYSGDV